MSESGYKIIVGIMILLLGWSAPCYAQDSKNISADNSYTFIFKGEPIKKALQQLVQTTHIDLIYDPAIMTDHTVFKTAKKETPEQVLRLILKDSGLDFIQLSSGTYVITTAPRKTIAKGHISGQVMDEQTGEPLAGANVMLADANAGSATSQTGHFSIPKIEPGFHEVTITYVGYKSVRDTVWIPANATASMSVSLVSEPVIVEPLVVSGIQKRQPSVLKPGSELQGSEIKDKRSFGSPDAVKSLNAIAGIDFSLPLADFNIQGGGQGDHQLQLDGVPVYNPVSLGRMMGAFSPWSIRKVTVRKAGFDAAAGSQLSGFINMQQDVNNAADNKFLFQANPMNVNGRYDHKFGNDDGPSINLMVAARANIWNLYKEPTLHNTLQTWDQLDPVLTLHLFKNTTDDTFLRTHDHSYDINYYDLHTAAKIDHNRFHQTTVSGYYGKNYLKTNLFSENREIPQNDAGGMGNSNLYYSIDRYDWSNAMTKVEHNWLASSRLDITFSGYLTHHSFDHNYILTNRESNLYNSAALNYTPQQVSSDNTEHLQTGDSNNILETSIDAQFDYSATYNYTISGGLGGKHIDYGFKLSDQYYNAAGSNQNSFLISGFIQNDILLSDKTSLTAGSRMTFIPSRDLVFAEPRLSLKHDEPNTSIGYISGKISGGIYRQFINQFDVSNVGPSTLVPSLRFWVPVDYTTTVPKAYHLAFDGLWEPSPSWKLRFESYYKWIPTRLSIRYSTLSGFPLSSANLLDASYTQYSEQSDYITSAKSYAYGTSLSLRKYIESLNLQLKSTYRYSIARQRIPSQFDNTYQPLPNSQPHNFSASANWNIAPNWTVLLQWQGIWGRSWAFRKAYYDYLTEQTEQSLGGHDFNSPGDDRLSRYSHLDAGLSYRMDIGSSKLQFRMDVFNLLDRQNVLNWWLSPRRNADNTLSYEMNKRTMSGIRPSLSIKLSY